MKERSILFSALLLIGASHFVKGQNTSHEPNKMTAKMTEVWDPEVNVVTPGKTLGDPPSDAFVLFDGNNLEMWVNKKDTTKKAGWRIVDNNYFKVIPGTGSIQTKMKFGDCQLHLEFSAPDSISKSGQGRENSGIFFQDRYELQILDSYKNRTYKNGQAASIYKDHAPLVNAMRTPLEWNTYDVIYSAPRFKPNGELDAPSRITVLHNGVLVQNNVTISGLTLNVGLHTYPSVHGEDVISLQDRAQRAVQEYLGAETLK